MKALTTLIGRAFFLVLAAGLGGCETPFLPDDLEDKKLAVSATMSTDPRLPGFLVFVSPVSPFGGAGGGDLIPDAEVLLYRQNQYIGQLAPGLLGDRDVYYLDLPPDENVAYTLRIHAEGFPSVAATDQMPERPFGRIISLEDLVKTTLPSQAVRHAFRLKTDIRDVPGMTNYFHVFIEAWLLDSLDNSYFSYCTLKNARNHDPSLKPYLLNQSLLVDGSLFDGEDKEFEWLCEVDVPDGLRLTEVQMDLRHVSAPYYFFHASHASQLSAGANGVTEPVVLYSNVQQGTGFLGAYQSTRDVIPVE